MATILKPSNTQVKVDEEIVELETDKVNQVLFAPKSGILNWNIKVGDTVKIGEVIGFVEEGKEPIKEEVKEAEEEKKEVKVGSTAKPAARIFKEESLKNLSSEEKPKEMPKVLKEAISGEKGERLETRTKMTKIRKVIAERLVNAKQQTAMLTTFNETDMTEIMALRERYKDIFLKEHGVKLGFMSFFVKAVAHALKAFPNVNSYIDGEDVVHREYYDIGIAVGTDRGLIVPVLRHADHLTFSEIEKEIEQYAKKARTGGLSVDDLTGGSFTITNGGVYGSLLSTPILNFPQSAILGMHKIMKRPVVIDDKIEIRQMMYVALSYDHRLIDGKEAVSFLVMVKNLLEDPSRLLLDI
ncbi:MAG TPA: dihydrolipoyllysine-residue succinyltransferase [Parachlamydiaceae bacterium]|nr:dihydrolipoyllysine-residue succinyltransferase [Parachlamydiaceae bacterium]